MRRYLVTVLLGIDILVNSLLGGQAYQTLSCRIGLSIRDGGWASRIPWPDPLEEHFRSAVYDAVV
jgi:hypothetical protein